MLRRLLLRLLRLLRLLMLLVRVVRLRHRLRRDHRLRLTRSLRLRRRRRRRLREGEPTPSRRLFAWSRLGRHRRRRRDGSRGRLRFLVRLRSSGDGRGGRASLRLFNVDGQHRSRLPRTAKGRTPDTCNIPINLAMLSRSSLDASPPPPPPPPPIPPIKLSNTDACGA